MYGAVRIFESGTNMRRMRFCVNGVTREYKGVPVGGLYTYKCTFLSAFFPRPKATRSTEKKE